MQATDRIARVLRPDVFLIRHPIAGETQTFQNVLVLKQEICHSGSRKLLNRH